MSQPTRAPDLLVLATDLMAMTPDVLLGLTAFPEADAVVPRAGGFSQPLCALYRRSAALAAAQHGLMHETLALKAMLDRLDVRWLEGDDLSALDPYGSALANVNTPEDYARVAARELRP